MINISDKENCCGCSACVQKCPKQCITLKEDNEGFLYPLVDKDKCIDCGLCEKVCPVLHQNESRKPLKVYAAINKNEEIRRQSSSGGVFTLLAEKIINEGGVVFGARFDDSWEVMHDYTDTIEGLAAFRGSKYVQSRIEDNFQKAENFLKEGRKVLFSGTPCQIAGLKSYLRKDYGNLLAVDFICHGVPSPGVWRRYLKETIARQCEKKSVSSDPISNENARVESISFRDKRSGWEKFSFALTLSATTRNGIKNTVSLCQVYHENLFMKGFLADLFLRPSCHHCPTKNIKSGSDITIADFWKIEDIIPDINSIDNGVSCLLLNTTNGINLFSLIYPFVDCREADFEYVCKYNKALYISSKKPEKRIDFYKKIQRHEISSTINEFTKRSLILRFKNRIIKYLKNLK